MRATSNFQLEGEIKKKNNSNKKTKKYQKNEDFIGKNKTQ